MQCAAGAAEGLRSREDRAPVPDTPGGARSELLSSSNKYHESRGAGQIAANQCVWLAISAAVTSGEQRRASRRRLLRGARAFFFVWFFSFRTKSLAIGLFLGGEST